MIISVHQHDIMHSQALETQARATVEPLRQRFGGRVTRVDVYIEDVNAAKGGGDDRRCLIEARVAGLAPVVAEARGSDPYVLVAAATGKLERAVETRVGRASARV